MQTRQDIKNEMTTSFVSNNTIKKVYGLREGKTFEQEFSLVSIENILFDVISYAVWLLSQFFVQHEKDVDVKIKNQKSGRLPWYRFMILNYQDGFQLLPESDQFDNSGATAEQIENAKKVKYCAVNNGDKPGVIIIKIAGENSNGVLEPVSDAVKEGVQSYVDRFGWAGNDFRVINNTPDKLIPHVVIYRDATVLDRNGVSKFDGTKPVETAIAEFMKELPFDGELILQSFVDKLQQVKGVKIVDLKAMYSSWISINSTTNLYNNPTLINVKRVPESGYFKIETLANITYVV